MSNKFTKEALSVSKTRYSLLAPKFLKGTADVLTLGAEKYNANNWRKCKPNQLYLYWDALYRHLEAFRSGETFDKESGINHLYHAACNIMFLSELEKRDEHK